MKILKILGISAKVGENITGGKLMSRSVRAADNKMAVISFELRVFLQGLRQKQHRWGAAWGIQNRFNQRFCIEKIGSHNFHQIQTRKFCCESLPELIFVSV